MAAAVSVWEGTDDFHKAGLQYHEGIRAKEPRVNGSLPCECTLRQEAEGWIEKPQVGFVKNVVLPRVLTRFEWCYLAHSCTRAQIRGARKIPASAGHHTGIRPRWAQKQAQRFHGRNKSTMLRRDYASHTGDSESVGNRREAAKGGTAQCPNALQHVVHLNSSRQLNLTLSRTTGYQDYHSHGLETSQYKGKPFIF